MTTRAEISRLLAFLGVGGLVFAGGLALARERVPEWRLGRLPAAEGFARRYRAIVDGLALRPLQGKPRVFLASDRQDLPSCKGQLRYSPLYAGLCTEVRVTVEQRSALEHETHARELAVSFAPSGEARSVVRTNASTEFVSVRRAEVVQAPVERFLPALLLPGESTEAPHRFELATTALLVYGVRGSSPPRHLTAMDVQNQVLSLERLPGDPGQAAALMERRKVLPSEVISGIVTLLSTLAVIILFAVLLARRRISVVNGALLSVVALIAALPAAVTSSDSPLLAGLASIAVVGRALWVFLAWSAAESFLRTADPGYTTSLDALRAARLGPRGGRGLLLGLALGAGLAGLRLAIQATALSLPGLWPEAASLRLPVFSSGHDPFSDGLLLAALVILLLGLARRVVPARWVPAVVILAGAFVTGPAQIRPYPVELAADALLLAPLVVLSQRSGVTALLTAAVSSLLLPAAVFAGLHANWLPGTFAATAIPLLGVLVFGFLGLARPPQVEQERLRAPGFMKRIDEERRIKYEMNLLTRMQEGLLPQPPRVPGWDIAACSILANEAGGDLYDFLMDEDGMLWVAAGDVAGHGYSCAIVQAMTTAALTSLISPQRTPAEVLRQVDRVIRRGGKGRHFASLALLRLDPQTGDAVFSNAGHPFPLLIGCGSGASEVTELALPGLPLGQGPPRKYLDHVFQIPPGGAVIFCSDGLAETSNARDEQYGYDRPLDVLAGAVGAASANGILDALLADWRRYLGREERPDDMTVVVLKRTGGVASQDPG